MAGVGSAAPAEPDAGPAPTPSQRSAIARAGSSGSWSSRRRSVRPRHAPLLHFNQRLRLGRRRDPGPDEGAVQASRVGRRRDHRLVQGAKARAIFVSVASGGAAPASRAARRATGKPWRARGPRRRRAAAPALGAPRATPPRVRPGRARLRAHVRGVGSASRHGCHKLRPIAATARIAMTATRPRIAIVRAGRTGRPWSSRCPRCPWPRAKKRTSRCRASRS